MAQTRIFRDRVVSMEQTLEGGEKHLELLKGLCLEAFPEFQYRGHALDHERDLFVMTLEAPDLRRKTVCWTRMIIFDAERIPALSAEPGAALRARIVKYLKGQASRPEIVVTFRHLEEGWVDTPEPSPARRRRRRGRPEKAGARPSERAGERQPGTSRPAHVTPPDRRPVPAVSAERLSGVPRSADQASGSLGQPRPSGPGRRRFRRRRRRGRGGGGGGGPAAPRTP